MICNQRLACCVLGAVLSLSSIALTSCGKRRLSPIGDSTGAVVASSQDFYAQLSNLPKEGKDSYADAVNSVLIMSLPRYYNYLITNLPDADMIIDGTRIANPRKAIIAARSDLLELSRDFETVGKLWQALGIEASQNLGSYEQYHAFLDNALKSRAGAGLRLADDGAVESSNTQTDPAKGGLSQQLENYKKADPWNDYRLKVIAKSPVNMFPVRTRVNLQRPLDESRGIPIPEAKPIAGVPDRNFVGRWIPNPQNHKYAVDYANEKLGVGIDYSSDEPASI